MIAALLAAVLVSTSAGGASRSEAKPSDEVEATAVSSSGAGVVLDFADHLLDGGEPFRAAGEYERYLFLCPGCERAAYAERRLAEAYRRGGRARDAAARFAAVVEAHPDSPEAPISARSAAEALEEAGEPGEASDAYRAFVTRFSGEPDTGEAWARSLRTALRAHDRERVRAALAVEAPANAPHVDGAGLLDALETRSPRRRSPALAGLMSAILPGAGHVYSGRLRDGVMAFIVNGLFLSGAYLAWDHDQYALAGALGAAEVFWYGGNVVGAVNAADRYNRRAEDAYFRSLERKWVPAAALSFRF